MDDFTNPKPPSIMRNRIDQKNQSKLTSQWAVSKRPQMNPYSALVGAFHCPVSGDKTFTERLYDAWISHCSVEKLSRIRSL
jgi:hypothetical protein